jgi:hypothetical protein
VREVQERVRPADESVQSNAKIIPQKFIEGSDYADPVKTKKKIFKTHYL